MAGNDNDKKPITAYPNFAPKKQEQNLPGTDKAMEPLAGTEPSIIY